MSGMTIEPETVTHAKKQAAKQRQLERRGIARDLLRSFGGGVESMVKEDVKCALAYADELLDQTKVDE